MAEDSSVSGAQRFLLADWGRTGTTIIAVIGAAVTFVRWTGGISVWMGRVDDRLGSVESSVGGQREILRQAVESTVEHAGHAVQAAERAEAAVTRAEIAVSRAETAVAENKRSQAAIVKGAVTTQQTIETQGKKVDNLKVQVVGRLDSLEWRIRMLEEQNRKALDSK